MNDESSKSARFFKLYTGVNSRLYAYLMIMVHNKDAAEELVQETAALLWARFDEYQEGTNFGAWAVAIARLKALEFLRGRRKSQMIFDDRFYELVSDQAAKSSEELPDHIEALRVCLEKLSDNQKNLLSMRFKKNFTIKRISQLSGRPLGSLYHYFSKMTRTLGDCVNRQMVQQTR